MRVQVGDWVKWHKRFGMSGIAEVMMVEPEIYINTKGIHDKGPQDWMRIQQADIIDSRGRRE